MSGSVTRLLRVVVNDHLYLVEVGDLTTSPIVVTVNGQPYRVTVDPDDPHTPALAAPEVAAQPRRPQASVRPAEANPPAGTQVRAPMPGTILGIAVKIGDPVAVRQTLCSLEAMKMRNAVCAPRDGVVGGVEVTDGQTVAQGQALFTLE